MERQRIPKHAKRVFHGMLFDIYRWRQKLFDKSYATFELARRPDTVTVVPVTPARRIVIEHQSQPGTGSFICLPGGIVDRGETPFKAAKRELHEEAGYTSSAWKRWYSMPGGFRTDLTVHVFVCRNAKKTEAHPDAGERIRTQEISFDEFIRVASAPGFRHPDIALHVLRARLHPKKLRALRRLLVGK